MEKNRKRTHAGLILGKFMPPTLGHQYLVDFARNWVDELTVVVGTLEAEPIPGELRYSWMKEMFPSVNMVHLTDENPQYPHEHPDFWDIWKNSLLKCMPGGPDYLFASDDYGFKLAEVLGATFVAVDLNREVVPVSATMVRSDPMKYWEYIPTVVRPHYVKRVCLMGPESTGKSVLSRRLAEHFNTVYVSEYARGFIEANDNQVNPDDFYYIAKGQPASEDALARQANRLLICDTDMLTTVIWNDFLGGNLPDWAKQMADERHYDLYLVADIDAPYIDDPQRFLPNHRKEFRDRCIHELEKRNRPYVIIGGDWEERFRQAVKAVEPLIRQG